MRIVPLSARKLVLGAGMLAALGFGATSAFARPQPADASRYNCGVQSSEFSCDLCCADAGIYDFEYNPRTRQCQCIR